MRTSARRRRGLALGRVAAILLAGALLGPVPTALTQPAANARVALPPAYLAWRTGGMPAGLEPKLDRLPGVTSAVVFLGDTVWMAESRRSRGALVQRVPAPLGIPLEVFAASAQKMARFIPSSERASVVGAMEQGRAVLGRASAELRRLGVGDRIVLRSGARIVVGAVVPDRVVSWSEVLVSRRTARRIGVSHARFALLDYTGSPTAGRVRRQITHLLKPGYPVRVRRPGAAAFRRVGDTTWPPIRMKRFFGEFTARPDPTRPGYLLMGSAFVRNHLVSRAVPLLGRSTCNRRVFPPLIAAMNELRSRGLAGLIHGYAGCYNARMVMRWPTGPISHHSWGAAVDINAAENPWGATPRQDPRLVALMERHGFMWGGRFNVPDGMHFEFVGR